MVDQSIELSKADCDLLALAKEAIGAVDNGPLPANMGFFEQITILYHYARAQFVCANFELSIESNNKAQETLVKIKAMLTAVEWSKNQMALLANSDLYQQLAELQEQVDITAKRLTLIKEAKATLSKLDAQYEMITTGMVSNPIDTGKNKAMNETSKKVIEACEADAKLQGRVFDAFGVLLQQPANPDDASGLAKAQLDFVTVMAGVTGVPPTVLDDEMLGPDYLAAMVAVVHEVANALHIDVGIFLVKVE